MALASSGSKLAISMDLANMRGAPVRKRGNEPTIVPDQPPPAGPKATLGLQATAGSPPLPTRPVPDSSGCTHHHPNPAPGRVPIGLPTAPAHVPLYRERRPNNAGA